MEGVLNRENMYGMSNLFSLMNLSEHYIIHRNQ